MPVNKCALIQAQTREALPTAVRQAIHDISQPLQALRMMLGLPGVVVDDQRRLPEKVERAVSDIDRQLAQLHTLARLIDAGSFGRSETVQFGEVLQYAQQLAPELWAQSGPMHVYGLDRPVHLPIRNAAWVLNALLEASVQSVPRSKIIVGVRGPRKEIVVAHDGAGMKTHDVAALEHTLNGNDEISLGSGLLLARLLVSAWGGCWRMRSIEFVGTIFYFSTPD